MNDEARVYSQVYALIKLSGKQYFSMIPNKVITLINNKRDVSYSPRYNVNIPIEKQDVSKDALAIIANIQYNYWCSNENEKKELLDNLNEIDRKKSNEAKNKYNPDNIFSKDKKQIKSNPNILPVVENKERWYMRLVNVIKRIIRR